MIGQRLGPYEITAKLGAGGMGEVYRATDTKLGREVAIKVLPAAFTEDRERLARFEREARLLAQLNHPNIAAIYGLEEAEGIRALVLELVEGPTLAERMQAGALPFNESLSVSLQISQALEEAHDKGIIHRDLKPQNIKASIEGKVKVLDFGLAKAMDPLSSNPETPSQLAQSPTLTFGATMQGVILGTAAYMSPEQAKGMAVDKRADIWAFGVVLYEMLVGRSLFIGDSIPDTLARVLQREIDWSALPESTPYAIRQLLRRCLQRNPKNRLHDIADARLVLEEVVRGEVEVPLAGAEPVGGARRSLFFRFWPAALLLVAAAGALVDRFVTPTKSPPPRTPLHLSVAMPPDLEVAWGRLTPDGSSLIFAAKRREDPESELALYRRRLDGFESVLMPGTAGIVDMIYFSADGRWLDFVHRVPSDQKVFRMLRMSVDGSGPPIERALLDQPGWSDFGTLGNGDILVIIGGDKQIVRLTGAGKAAGAPIPIDAGRSGTISTGLSPTLPNDRGVLLTMMTRDASGAQYAVLLVDPTTGKGTTLVENGGVPKYVESGHLLFTRGPVLLGARFDVDSGRLDGTPVALHGGVRTPAAYALALFDLSRDGTLLYSPGGIVGDQRRLIVLAPGEKEASAWNAERRAFDAVVSDGRSAYVLLANARNVWEIWQVPRDGPAQPLVALPGEDIWCPVISPDGRQLAFQPFGRDENDGVYLVSLPEGGSPRLLRRVAAIGDNLVPLSFSRDGKRLLAGSVHENQVSVVELAIGESGEREPRVLIPSSASEAKFSPDDKWLAFASDASGRDEVYVAAYSRQVALGQRKAVSRGGGNYPRWSPDGRKLYFVTLDHRLLVAEISPDGAVLGEPTLAADLRTLRALDDFQVLPDGKLLLIEKGELEEGIRQFDLIFGFGEELKRRIP